MGVPIPVRSATEPGASKLAPSTTPRLGVAPPEDRFVVEERIAGLRGEAAAPSGARRVAMHLLVVLVACGLRLVDVVRPVDGTGPDGPRETPRAAVARNFHRDGMNILRPTVERPDGTAAVAAMELPLLPWLVGGLYDVVGERPLLLRLASCSFSILAFLLFASTARHLLPPGGATAAAWVFAVSPPAVRFATAATSDSAALCLALAAATCLLHRRGTGRRAVLAVSSVLTGLAVALAPAAAVLLPVLGIASAVRRGWRSFVRPGLWIFAVVAIGLPAAWFAHAYRLFRTDGVAPGFDEPFRLPIGARDVQTWATYLRSDDFREALRIGGAAWQEQIRAAVPVAGLVLGGLGLVALCVRPRRPSVVAWLVSAAGMLYLTALVPAAEFAPGAQLLLAVPCALTIGAAVALAGSWTSSKIAWRILATGALVLGAALLLADRFPEKLLELGWEQRLAAFAVGWGLPAPERVAEVAGRLGLAPGLSPLGLLLATTGIVMGFAGLATFPAAAISAGPTGTACAATGNRLTAGAKRWGLAGVSAVVVLLFSATVLEGGRQILRNRPIRGAGPAAAAAAHLVPDQEGAVVGNANEGALP